LLSALDQWAAADWAASTTRGGCTRGEAARRRGAARSAQHLIADRLRPADVASVEEIQPGEGKVIVCDGRRCAVYRDDDGGLHAVSAACTHGLRRRLQRGRAQLGCPCHGSRYSVDGAVLQGPASGPWKPS
jgi:nitrite reductase/ring-hydroxylating ferredoxin subunit